MTWQEDLRADFGLAPLKPSYPWDLPFCYPPDLLAALGRAHTEGHGRIRADYDARHLSSVPTVQGVAHSTEIVPTPASLIVDPVAGTVYAWADAWADPPQADEAAEQAAWEEREAAAAAQLTLQLQSRSARPKQAVVGLCPPMDRDGVRLMLSQIEDAQ